MYIFKFKAVLLGGLWDRAAKRRDRRQASAIADSPPSSARQRPILSFVGMLFFAIIIGIPFGRQRFKIAHFVLTPLGCGF